MKLKDILSNRPRHIEVRTNDPYGEDMLSGYCYWTGTTLVSGDGDIYSLDDEITGYKFDEKNCTLTCWIVSEWV